MLVRLAFHQLDPVVDQVGVEVFDLLLRKLDVFEPGGDLVVVEDALLETFLNELLQFVDFRKRDCDGEQRRLTSRLCEGGWGPRSTSWSRTSGARCPRPSLSPFGSYSGPGK